MCVCVTSDLPLWPWWRRIDCFYVHWQSWYDSLTVAIFTPLTRILRLSAPILWFESEFCCGGLFLSSHFELWMYPSRDCVSAVQQKQSKQRSGGALSLGDFNCPVMDRDLDQVGKQTFRRKNSCGTGLAPVVQHSVDSLLLMSPSTRASFKSQIISCYFSPSLYFFF